MNSAYKHLEAKLRVGEFTLGQWLGLFFGAITALTWGFYVSPFGTSLTLFSACYVGGLPAAAIFLAAMSEVDVVLIARSAVRWKREEGRYLAGPGPASNGYVVRDDVTAGRAHSDAGGQLADLDLQALWES
jgi:hypothetical protein